MKLELRGKRNPSSIVVSEMLSKRYGWTPNQIRKMSYQDIASYIDIIYASNQIQREEEKRANRKLNRR